MTGETLALFDSVRMCPKCGGDARASYEPPRRSGETRRLNGHRVYLDDPLGPLIDGEFMLRTCDHCHYQWPEAPKDARRG